MMFEREEDEESSIEEAKIETPAPNREEEEELSAVNLMSPASQQVHTSQVQQLHHPILANHQHQANHFVAFESDEDDSQQYDLVPIVNGSSRNTQGPHPSTQVGASGAPNVAAPHNNVVRNRYYESGSGEDEIDAAPATTAAIVNNQEEDENLQQQEEDLDNFQVDYQDSRP